MYILKLMLNVSRMRACCAVSFILGASLLINTPISASAVKYDGAIENSVECIYTIEEHTMLKIEDLFALNGLEYYAYMDLDKISDSLKPVVLEARNRIIFNTSWVADEINGRIRDEDGNIIEILPHFSDLFPSDWEIPTISDALSTECCG